MQVWFYPKFHYVPNPDAINLNDFPNSYAFQFGYTCSGLEGCVTNAAYAHVCSRMLTYAQICSNMPKYAHVCSRMLTYAGG